MNIYMSMDDFNELFDNDAAYFNGYVSNEKLESRCSLLCRRHYTPDDMRAVGDQFIGMMSKMIGMMVGLAVFIFLLFMYLLTKAVIDHSARSISYMKVFGYRDSEISHLYIRSITLCVVASLRAGLPVLSARSRPSSARCCSPTTAISRSTCPLGDGCMRRHWLCDLPGRGAATHAFYRA